MKPKHRRRLAVATCAATAMMTLHAARAQGPDEAQALRDSTVRLINLMVERGVIPRDKANALIGQAVSPSAAAPAAAVPSGPAQTEEIRRLRNTNADLVNLLVEKGVLGRDVGDALIDQSQARGGREAAPPVAVIPAPLPVAPVPVPDTPAVVEPEPRPLPPPTTPPVRVVGLDEPPPPPPSREVQIDETSPAMPVAPVAESRAVTAEPAVPLAASPDEVPASATAPVAQPTPPPAAAATTTAAPEASAPAAAPGVVRVPYVPQIVRDQMKEEIRREVLAQAKEERWGEPGALPDWLKRITPFGDVRVREEVDRFPDGSRPNADPAVFAAPPYGSSISNTTDTRSRLRLRARLGLKASISDQISAGIRISSGPVGSGATPVSENVSLGNYNSRNTIGIDRAYIAYRPFDSLSLTAGRFDNPFFTPTDLVWSTSDSLSLEGLAVSYKPVFPGNFDAGANVGAFPIQQKDNQLIPTPGSDAQDKWLYGVQALAGWRFLPTAKANFGVAYYHYENIEGCLNPTINSTDCDSTTAGFRQFGNQVFDIRRLTNEANNTQAYLFGLLSQFRELNVSASVNVSEFSPVHVLIDADWVRNLGFDRDEIRRRTGVTDPALLSKEIDGYQLRVTVGTPSVAKQAQWQVYTGYRRVERDATLDAFTDSDFHLGGTNAKGYFLGGRYGLAKNTVASLKWLSADSIEGPPLAIDVLQLDLGVKF